VGAGERSCTEAGFLEGVSHDSLSILWCCGGAVTSV